MNDLIQAKELHLFKRLDTFLAFDVNDLHLFEVNEEAYALLREAAGKSARQTVDALANRFDRDTLTDILGQLMDAGLLGFALPSPRPPDYEDEFGFKSVTLFVSQDCNLRCRYCLTLHDGNIVKKKMSKETARKAVDLLFREAGDRRDLSIGFFGGEPLLNVEAIKAAVDYAGQKAEETGKTITYTITTNGTLINDEMAAFFKKHKITVALSVDGSREIHDANRVFSNGQGSFAQVLKGIETLKAHDNFIGAVAVVHDRRYRFKDVVLPIIESGVANVKITTAIGKDGGIPIVDGDPDWYGGVYEELVQHLLKRELLFADPPPISFPQTFKALESKKSPRTACSGSYGQVMVGPDGRIFPCENFIGRDAFCMGHVASGLDKSLQDSFRFQRASNNEECRECWARNVCGGWCPYYSWINHGHLAQPVKSMCVVKRSYLEVAMAAYSQYKNFLRAQEQQA